jgi:urea transport system ATP-binding protein
MNDAGPDVNVAHAQLLGEDGGDRKSRVDSASLLLVTLGLGVVPLLYLTGNMEIVQVNMLGRYLCFAIVAVSLDLIWGYTGLLCLCQSMFFALGGYAMGMYLAHHGGPEGIVDATGWKIPGCLFYVYPGGVGETQKDWLLPFFWKPFFWFEFTVILGLLIPGLVAMVIGFFVFRSRVRGVFFAILTQALTLAVWLVFSMNNMKLCGTNGMNRFKQVGPFFDPGHDGSMTKLGILLAIFLGINLFFLLRAIVKWVRSFLADEDRSLWRDPLQLGALAVSLLIGLGVALWIKGYVIANFQDLDELRDHGVKFVLYLVTVMLLLDVYLLCRFIVQSRLGRVLVAIRDKESRLRFSGYRPYVYKVFIFSVSAMIAGLGGMLYAPQMGIFTPTNLEPKESILVVIWVAVGGRNSLSGPIIGALFVNLVYNYLTGSSPETWPFLQGALFVAVVLARPDGLVSLKRDFPWYTRALGIPSRSWSPPDRSGESRPLLARAVASYANFHGRSGRKEYWYFTVFHLLFLLLLTAAAMLVDPTGFMQIFTGEEVIKTPDETMKTITLVLRLALIGYLALMLIPYVAVTIRRTHDIGLSAWWLLLVAVPLLGWLLLPSGGLDLGVNLKVFLVLVVLAITIPLLLTLVGLAVLMSLRGSTEANRYGEVPDLEIDAREDLVEEEEVAESLEMQERLRRVANIQRLQGDKPQIEADILSVHDLTVVFDGFKALDIDEFHLPHYMLQVIIGPNGAGKTTLCDVISGKTRPTTGRVIFNGEDITEASEADIALMGVGRKFQTPTIYDSLTVFQNMELALPDSQGLARNLWRGTSMAERDRIMQMLRRVRLDDDAMRLVEFLSHGQRQWLEISMLILSDPELLLVDEPAAGLTDEETVLTAELLLELQEDHSIIVIEHDMEFVRLLNAPVVVLNEGLIMASGSMEEVQADERVVEAYLGRGGASKSSIGRNDTNTGDMKSVEP